eukprot:PhM_4_TR17754/c0_g1_i1/m.54937/K05284/PIGM; phosphatidylinositol glycan, class M
MMKPVPPPPTRFTVRNVFIAALVIRIIMVHYSLLHDYIFDMNYTDIDYEVVNDGAAHMVKGGSPFDRETYRYSPLLALMLVPGHLLGIQLVFGKILFSLCDLAVGAVLIRALKHGGVYRFLPMYVAVYLLNPLNISVSTRGNGDCIAGLLIVGALLAFEMKKFTLSAVVFAAVVHLRIFPIMLAPMFLLVPHRAASIKQKLYFSVLSGSTYLVLTGLSYAAYGDKCLWEMLLYHLSRIDHRHNLAPHFYMYYLEPVRPMSLVKLFTSVEGLIRLVPAIGPLMLVLIVAYRCREDIYTGAFFIILTFVTFNRVQTVQYFNWYLTLLPLMLPKLRTALRTNTRRISFTLQLVVPWIMTFVLWMQFSFMLEFRGMNTYTALWLTSMAFFLNYVHILVRLWMILAPRVIVY